MVAEIGLIGSPSTTAKVTVDILEDATGFPLRGQLVALSHQLDEKFLIALGTVTEIRTSNRWHEDANMRGVLKKHGSLPHLSAVGDVRTADVVVQAVYLAESGSPADGDPPIESGGALSMSPTTGARVTRVTDSFLDSLLRRHRDEIVYLGKAFGMEDVRLPLTLRHFGDTDSGGAGEAYHTGVFGMTGSGKSVFTAYMLAAMLRHRELGVLIMDPQGQFTSEHGLPFSLQEWAEAQGRSVETHSISADLRLQKDAFLLGDLLNRTRFFRDILSLRGEDARDSALAEFVRELQRCDAWENRDADDVLRTVLTGLANDLRAIQRIYATPQNQQKLVGILNDILTDAGQFQLASSLFGALHSLFSARNLSGGLRRPVHGVLQQLLQSGAAARPLVIIDFSQTASGIAADPDGPASLLESGPVKARILRYLCSTLNRTAERQFTAGRSLNTLVVFDEAQRFAAENPEDDESKELAEKLVDYVRTTRKYGLGWMFITQEVGSIRRGIYSQLRVRCFGYGLTSGTELQRLRETIGDPDALELYRSFVDPQAIRPPKYPFMLTGPVSPLSFTGAPVFVSVYTDFNQFRADNGRSS